MNCLVFVAGLAIVFAAGCNGNSYKMGGCPRVVVMKSLDFDKFTGEWYVVQTFNPMATCVKLSIEKGPNNTYAVNETYRPFGLPLGFYNQFRKARKLSFLRDDTNSIFRLQRNFAVMSLSTFGVVDTDYDNFAVVWGCDPVLFGSIQNIDILTRDPKPSSDVLQKAKAVVEEMKVDTHPLDNVNHSRCENSAKEGEPSTGGDENTNNIVIDGP